jgi:hypothetical protein
MKANGWIVGEEAIIVTEATQFTPGDALKLH